MNWMTMREFLRGGHKKLTGPTVVSSHGKPVWTVFPHDKNVVVTIDEPQAKSKRGRASR